MRQLLGRWGERAAARFLRRQGFAIVARNYRSRVGEIDLIALDGATLVFVEVKTRTGTTYGTGLEAVGARKQRQVLRAALWFAARHRLLDRPLRFDVVAVSRQHGRAVCEHVRGALEFSRRRRS